jgi:cyanophycinase
MPAPVPPGYTRGPLLFLGAFVDPVVEVSLRQWLWREAGGYGARLVLITVQANYVETVATLRQQLESLECDRIGEIVALDRIAARDPVHIVPVEQATGIVLVGDDPLLMAAILGGTPLAQAIRRANAHSKLVAGLGAAGAFLCQHLIGPGSQPATLRGMVAFGPGLGLVNRLVLDATSSITPLPIVHEQRLLAAVALNPFLIGVGLPAGSAAILYTDNTLQAAGPNPVTIVDGQFILSADLNAAPGEGITGALCYTLHTGDGFNLDEHSLRPAGEVDLPPTGPVTDVF